MIDYIITALPRSGTAWLANFLTDGPSLCLHDPLMLNHYNDLSIIAGSLKRRCRYTTVGVCCTALWRFPDALKSFHCPVLFIDRPVDKVQRSLVFSNLPALSCDELAKFESCKEQFGKGGAIGYSALFDDVKFKRWVTDNLKNMIDFDEERHRRLKDVKIEVMLEKRRKCDKAIMRLSQELAN